MAKVFSLDDFKKDEKKPQGKFSVNSAAKHSSNTILYDDVPEQEEAINITLWKNGFTINDGPLRDFSSKENQEFIEDVKNGFIPKELIKEGKSEANVTMTDRSSDDYEKPYSPNLMNQINKKPQQPSFQGKGMTLNSNAAANNFIIEGNAKEVDMTKPTVNIKIRFVDGKQKVFKINSDWTVNDVYALVKSESGISAFRLMQMPKKIIEPSDISVTEAKIANASLVQQK